MTAPTFDVLLDATRRNFALAPQLATRALAERREDEALALFAQRIAAAQNDATVMQFIGLLHRACGDLVPAIAALDRAVALAPGNARAVHARARAAMEAGLPSRDWFARARGLAPNDGDIILGQAAALAAENAGEEAETLLAGMLGVHPGWLPGHDTLIRLRHANGHPEPFAEIDRAIAGAPNDLRLHRIKILALHRGRDPEGALRAVGAALRTKGADASIDALAAMVLTEAGRLTEADAAFARIAPYDDPLAAVHWWRHLLRRGDAPQVAAAADTLPDALRDLAWPYLSAAWRLTNDPRSEWLDDPRLIQTIRITEDTAWLARLAEVLRPLHTARAEPLDQSVRGGTQTDGPLFSRVEPMIIELRTRIAAAVDRYLAELPPGDPGHPLLGHKPQRARFTGSWSVRLTGGGHHDPHVHTAGRISSAFYVALPGSENEAGWLTLGQPQASLATNLPPQRTIEPRAGTLALFPSTSWHGTRPFAAGERLTVAFDVA